MMKLRDVLFVRVSLEYRWGGSFQNTTEARTAGHDAYSSYVESTYE